MHIVNNGQLAHTYIIIIIIQTPVERVLGRGHKVRSSGGTREVKECCYDIPLLESLQALLKNVSVCDQVIRKD